MKVFTDQEEKIYIKSDDEMMYAMMREHYDRPANTLEILSSKSLTHSVTNFIPTVLIKSKFS